jgi:hypothetical protein
MRSGLRCQAYSSSVHRRRYSRFADANGRGGKSDFGNRRVLDHDARRTRVGISIIASWAEEVDVGAPNVFFDSSTSFGDGSARRRR